MILFTVCYLWIDESFEVEALVEIQLIDVDELDFDFTIALTGIGHIKEAGQLLELRMAEIFESQTQLNRSVITH